MDTRCYYTSCLPPLLAIVVHGVGWVETPDYVWELQSALQQVCHSRVLQDVNFWRARSCALHVQSARGTHAH